MKQVEYESHIIDIPLEKLEIGKDQIRTVDIGKDIHDLANSIARMGLIQPISVRPTNKGKYEIVAGQRRYLAHKELKAKTIRAQVVAGNFDELELKLLSLHENMSRKDLAAKDEKDACLIYYRRYGDINIVIQETGLPATKVRKYLKFHSLSSKLQKMVDQGDVGIDEALRAQKAAGISGKFDEEKAVSLAIEMKPMSGAQRTNLENIFAEDPKQSIESAIEKAAEKKVIQITTTITNTILQGLKSFAKDEDLKQDIAVASLIEEGLTDKGYLNSNS